MNVTDRSGEEVVTARSPWMVWFFRRVFLRQLHLNFHALRLLTPPPKELDLPQGKLFFTNHPSWNDPMLLFFLHHHFFPQLEAYAPIDANALESYGFMRRIGLFGVDRRDPGSVRQFLRISNHVLKKDDAALWITPQGRFADARERPARFEGGLGLLLKTFQEPVCACPVAIEYVFGAEKQPEIFVSFGQPVVPPEENSIAAWTRACELALEKTQDELAARVVAKDGDSFTTMLGGRTGVGGIYGAWQRFKALLAGKRFDPSHASVTQK